MADIIGHKRDVLCRFVVILCGIEQRPAGETALLPGINKHAVDVANCVALDSLDVIWRQAILASDGCIAMAN